MLFRIEAVIAERVEIPFVDMYDKPPDEFMGRDGLILALFILMAVVPERDLPAVVTGNARLGHCRPSNVSGDIAGHGVG